MARKFFKLTEVSCVASDGGSTPCWALSDDDLRYHEPIKECALVVGQCIAEIAMND